jgi:hypothetical protein
MIGFVVPIATRISRLMETSVSGTEIAFDENVDWDSPGGCPG